MKRNNIFWGTALILLGVLFFLQTQGLIGSVFPYIWPLALILFGGWMILGVYLSNRFPEEDERVEIALQNAKSVRYRFSHGAGQLEIKGGAPTGRALVGSAAMGMNESSYLDVDRLNVKVDAGASFIPFVGPADGAYRFQITQEVPVSVKVETGASQLDLDLKDVLAERIQIQTGATTAKVILPARGESILDIEAGATSFDIRVPEGVSGRISIKEGLTALNVDMQRFPQLDSRHYQSPDYESAANRTEINIESGLGSINIK